ncbi:hypothetical protein CC80DRAFT_545806 [Byssothecium circinans]|uniref:Uncharacterized protein n=1 Tax=Byssothecium circinans TaxID=147558 RepID=A0A6A5U3H5_9PLEO|nr:hypothetical protein CC80DRAFT_545806 [Byssothecium circinans]
MGNLYSQGAPLNDSPLLRLPTEIRLQIFEYAFGDAVIGSAYDFAERRFTYVLEKRMTKAKQPRVDAKAFSVTNYLALTEVCRQIRADTALIPFETGWFCEIVYWWDSRAEKKKGKAKEAATEKDKAEAENGTTAVVEKEKQPAHTPKPFSIFPWLICLTAPQLTAIRKIRLSARKATPFWVSYPGNVPPFSGLDLSAFTGVRSVIMQLTWEFDSPVPDRCCQKAIEEVLGYLGRRDVEVRVEQQVGYHSYTMLAVWKGEAYKRLIWIPKRKVEKEKKGKKTEEEEPTV